MRKQLTVKLYSLNVVTIKYTELSVGTMSEHVIHSLTSGSKKIGYPWNR